MALHRSMHDTLALSYSQNAWGRLTAVEFRQENEPDTETFSYQYSYNQAGRVTAQRLRVNPS